MSHHVTQDPDSPFFESDHGLTPAASSAPVDPARLADARLALRAAEDRALQEAAWYDGYEACRRGDQKHNPYSAPPATSRGLRWNRPAGPFDPPDLSGRVPYGPYSGPSDGT